MNKVSKTKYSPTVWLADLTYTQQTVAADVMPNAIGGIATFTEACLGLERPIRLFKYPERLVAALESDGVPQVVGFSNYVWNFSLSYRFAEVLKMVRPEIITIFGGPNYPTSEIEQKEFLRRHRAIDLYIIKEGELAFSRVLESLICSNGDLELVREKAIPSVHSICANSEVHISETTERIVDLSEIPSPYLSGKMEEFFDGTLLPIVQTNRGCPFSCTFCVEGVGYYNKVYTNSAVKTNSEFDLIGKKMQALQQSGGRNDLFIADSNFGMYKQDLDTCQTLAETRRKYGWPEYINVATGKNKKERVLEAARILGGALRLSGSVQSLDKDVLSNIKRSNISADGLMDLALEASQVGANTYSEIILGLPGDTLEKHFRTVETVINSGFTNIYLFQLMLLPGTELATREVIDQYDMTTKYRILPRCYGHFDVLGEKVVSAEIESICVANSTLSFEDYLECRKLHLLVTIFYNDSIFGTLPKLLRLLGIPVFQWITALIEQAPSPSLQKLFDSFAAATSTELWDSRKDLEEFIKEAGVVDRFISGELGNNLLFVHKTLAVTQHIEELADLACKAMKECIYHSSVGSDRQVIMTFVEDALLYHVAKAKDIFINTTEIVAEELRFDIRAFEEREKPGSINDFTLSTPRTFSFYLDDSQKQLIDRYLGIYGDSPVGIGRILSKVFVRKLFRHCRFDSDQFRVPGGRDKSTSNDQFHIAGLQN